MIWCWKMLPKLRETVHLATSCMLWSISELCSSSSNIRSMSAICAWWSLWMQGLLSLVQPGKLWLYVFSLIFCRRSLAIFSLSCYPFRFIDQRAEGQLGLIASITVQKSCGKLRKEPYFIFTGASVVRERLVKNRLDTPFASVMSPSISKAFV